MYHCLQALLHSDSPKLSRVGQTVGVPLLVPSQQKDTGEHIRRKLLLNGNTIFRQSKSIARNAFLNVHYMSRNDVSI